MWTLRLGDNGQPEPPERFRDDSRVTAVSLPDPQFSPDGRWIAFSSADSGASQIYVVPFPGSGGKWQISTDGGSEPRWSKNGHELFFIYNSAVLAVSYSVQGNSFQAGIPKVLFDSKIEMRAPYTSFDTTPDGQHFVAFQFEGGKPSTHPDPTIVLNWLTAVRRQLSAGQSAAP
jgi:dipeptidyl aminopeptidase/acylaminoacyl peptidase